MNDELWALMIKLYAKLMNSEVIEMLPYISFVFSVICSAEMIAASWIPFLNIIDTINNDVILLIEWKMYWYPSPWMTLVKAKHRTLPNYTLPQLSRSFVELIETRCSFSSNESLSELAGSIAYNAGSTRIQVPLFKCHNAGMLSSPL